MAEVSYKVLAREGQDEGLSPRQEGIATLKTQSVLKLTSNRKCSRIAPLPGPAVWFAELLLSKED